MHPLYGALPVQYVTVRVTCGVPSAHRFPYSIPRCRPLERPGTILLTLYSMVWDWRVSRAGPMFFYWPKLLDPFSSSTTFLVLFVLSICWYCGNVVFGPIGCTSLSLSLALSISINKNN